jgi:hypothetical protein
MNLRAIFFNILVGLPSGCLIIMGMFMLNAVLGKLFPVGPWLMLILLCFTSFIIGMLTRLLQPFHGIGTALASGVIAALLILFLRLTFLPASVPALVSAVLGLLVTIVFSLLGAWILPHLRKRKTR